MHLKLKKVASAYVIFVDSCIQVMHKSIINMERPLMNMSTHFDCRMNQRGIRKGLTDLALELGEMDGDRYVLTTRIIDQENEKMRLRKKLLDDARKKGGVVVIAEDGTLITTYHTDSFNAKLVKNK